MSVKYIITSYKQGVRTITLNRPERKNALCENMYKKLTQILNEDSTDDNIVVTIITGHGNYFTSGNDLKAAMEVDDSKKVNVIKEMIDAFINYPKLLIAVVNGPAVGIGATMAALCDVVYASERAVFDTPFVRLGLCAEAASSYTFPASLGRSKASEVLLLNHKLGAQEAYQFGLISNVIPHSLLKDFINELHKYGKLRVKTLQINKKLIMSNFKSILHECNTREVEQLQECVESEEFSAALLKFMTKKSKL